ncbi:MAG: tetratricopeptide repeat protein [Planctomycetota bacterium]
MKERLLLVALIGVFAVTAIAVWRWTRAPRESPEDEKIWPLREAVREEQERQEELAERIGPLTEPGTSLRPPPPKEKPEPEKEPEPEAEPPARSEEASVLLERGLAASVEGRYEEAAGFIARAALLDPRRPEAYFYLSYLAAARGDWARALHYLRRAMRADPRWLERAPDPLKLFGGPEAYAKNVARLEARVRNRPNDAAAKALLAFHYYFAESGARAKAMAVEALSADPDQKEAGALLEKLEKAGY